MTDREVANAETLEATPDSRPRRDSGAPISAGVVLCARYEVRGLIGQGGMGRVFEAWDRLVGREVALKMVRPADGTSSAGELARLRDELVAIQEVVHPGIVRTYTLEEDGAERFIVMERLRGKSLGDEMRGDRLGEAAIVWIGQAILAALAAAHARGIAHRDVKPANVFLSDAARVVLLDFGLARTGLPIGGELESGVSIDGTTLSGTPGYMAPEVIRGARADARADVYAVGVLLFELITGAHPYPGAGLALLAAHLEEPVPEVPGRLGPVVRRMLAKDPAARPAADPAILAPPRRRRGRIVAGAALVAAGIAVAVLANRPQDRDPPPPPPPPVAADPEALAQAEQLHNLGQEHYNAARFAEAIQAFEEAYVLSQEPAMLFNLAQAHRLHGDPSRALMLFRRYIATTDGPSEAAQKQIERLEAFFDAGVR